MLIMLAQKAKAHAAGRGVCGKAAKFQFPHPPMLKPTNAGDQKAPCRNGRSLSRGEIEFRVNRGLDRETTCWPARPHSGSATPRAICPTLCAEREATFQSHPFYKNRAQLGQPHGAGASGAPKSPQDARDRHACFAEAMAEKGSKTMSIFHPARLTPAPKAGEMSDNGHL